MWSIGRKIVKILRFLSGELVDSLKKNHNFNLALFTGVV
jgi:hypothetical protein